jgi:hypothetical protein
VHEQQQRITALEEALAKYDRLSEQDSIEIAQLQQRIMAVEEALKACVADLEIFNTCGDALQRGKHALGEH